MAELPDSRYLGHRLLRCDVCCLHFPMRIRWLSGGNTAVPCARDAIFVHGPPPGCVMQGHDVPSGLI